MKPEQWMAACLRDESEQLTAAVRELEYRIGWLESEQDEEWMPAS